jgi:Tol biopolymer transport system component
MMLSIGFSLQASLVSAQTNGRLVYSSDVEGNKEIYSMNPNGTDIRRLTNNPAGDEGAIWSPDGTKIVFKSNRNTSGAKNDYDLFIMNADGSNVKAITDFHPSHERGASFLSDGTRITFSSDKDGDFDIYTIKLDGTDLKQVVNATGSQTTTHWHPSGNRIAFSNRTAQGLMGISQVMLTTGVVTSITNNADYHSQIPAWSPDGTKMAFRRDRVDSTTDDTEISIMNADGSNQRNLTNNTANDLGPAWSPDGSKIAFSSLRDGNSEIYIMNADGSNQVRITTTTANEDDIDWGINSGGTTPPDPTAIPTPINTPVATPTDTLNPTSTQSPGNPADVDNNGNLNVADLQALVTNFNQTQFSIRDPRPDGIIDIFDFNLVISSLSRDTSPPPLTQPPSTSPTKTQSASSPTQAPTPTLGTQARQPDELVIFDDQLQFSYADSGFLFVKERGENPQKLPLNLQQPNNYYAGTWHMRYEITQHPSNSLGSFQFCSWAYPKNEDYNGDGSTDLREICSSIHHDGKGTYYQESSPTTWWSKYGVFDMKDTLNLRFGVILRHYLGSVIREDNGELRHQYCIVTRKDQVKGNCWEHWEKYEAMKLKLTIVAVPEGKTFSGWQNYP